ncbi:MAG: thiamine monophosphate kinase [bacterium ADurb.Bin374]|nr:MAG: thiamine monophosphate kinase [bacterium ADurb.Bin374]
MNERKAYMDEFERIKSLAKVFPRHRDQLNSLFESDAEIVTMGDRKLAITIDEFSAEEDGFPSDDPETLGWNLVIATISDLLAVGADPKWLLHVVSVPDNRSDDFCDRLMKGVGGALAMCGPRPILRKTDVRHLQLYATGPFGSGNLVFLSAGSRFKLATRRQLVTETRDNIALAMDTSDGYRNTLLTLLKVNPGHSIIARADPGIVHPDVQEFCDRNRLPPEGFLFGSAGEYELILGVEPARLEAFEKAAGSRVFPIGTMTSDEEINAGTLFWQHPTRSAPIPDLPVSIDPRETPDRSAYIQELLHVIGRLFHR